MKPRTTLAGPFVGLLLLVLALPGAGCEGYEQPRFPVGDTVVLYSLARTDYIGQPSAFDFVGPQAVVLERPPGRDYQNFDVAFTEMDGHFVLLPAGLFENFSISPGLVRVQGNAFETLEEAPEEGYVTDAPVVIGEGELYAVRTRGGGACTRYGKLEILELDPDGLLEFRFLSNNLCNDRDLSEAEEE